LKRTLKTQDNLFDYFHEHVGDARQITGVEIEDQTALYLATLLTERARADANVPTHSTLAELHGAAANAPPAKQARTYRELGDTALYALGYFDESLERRIVSADYYRDMGSAAYWRADQVFKRWFSDAFGPVFHELANGFEDCVRVVTTVRDAHLGATPEDVMSLYARWERNPSEELAARLRVAGVILPNGGLSEA